MADNNCIKIQTVDGVLLVDSRLIAQRLEVQHDNLLQTLQEYQTVIEEAFGAILFQTGSRQDGNKGGKQPRYAMLTEDQATVLMTFSRNTPVVVKAKIDLVKAFSQAKELLRNQPAPSPQPQHAIPPGWHERMIQYEMQCKIPKGYFTIFAETISIVRQLQVFGYNLLDSHYPDISIGACWANYLRKSDYLTKQGLKLEEVRTTYLHVYPDVRVVEAHCYKNLILGRFHDWMEEEYKTSKLLPYLQRKNQDSAEDMRRIEQYVGLILSTQRKD